MKHLYLDKNEYEVLLALQKDPLASISDIREDISKRDSKERSFYSVKKAFTSLLEKGIIKNFAASIDPSKIGLEKRSYFFNTSSFKKTQELEKILDSHNYSRYRCRAITGPKTGLYVEFEIPPGTEGYIEELIDILTKKQYIFNVLELGKEENVIQTNINLKFIDPSSLQWTFNFEEWINGNEKNDGNTIKIASKIEKKKINETDLWLMRILTINPRQKNKDLLQNLQEEKKKLTGTELQKDLTTISRRKNYILENYIGDTQVLINSEIFSLDVRMIFNVIMKKKYVEEIKKKLINNPLPFRTNFVETKKGFRWYIYRSPTSYVNQLTNWIWSMDPECMRTIHWLPFGRLYWFYPLNYDLETTDWKKSREHFFDPIQKFL